MTVLVAILAIANVIQTVFYLIWIKIQKSDQDKAYEMSIKNYELCARSYEAQKQWQDYQRNISEINEIRLQEQHATFIKALQEGKVSLATRDKE